MFCRLRKTKSTNLSVRRGFSLVELLITMAIGVVMTSVLFAMKNNDGAVRDVDIAAQQVVVQLRSLQNEALSGKKIELTPGSWATACTYRFDTTAETSYGVSYFNDCSFAPSNLVVSLPAVALKNVKLTAGFVFFQSPNGETNGNNMITVTSTKDLNIKVYVLVSQAGNIEISKTGT